MINNKKITNKKVTNTKISKDRIRRKEDSVMINMFFYLILPFLIAVPVMLILYYAYYNLQSMLFSDKNTLLLFIHDVKSQVVIVGVPIILALLCIIKYKNKETFSMDKKGVYNKLILIILGASILFLTIDFFNYSVISTDGIKVRTGITNSIKEYTWEDVAAVDVSYDYGYKNSIEVAYYLNLNDGKRVNAFNSNHFFDEILNLDDYIIEKGVPIARDVIKSEDMEKFKTQFEGKGRTTVDRLNVLIELFQKNE